MVDLLLRHGADHEAVTHVAADTPLHSAAKKGHLASVELLLLHGSIIDCRNGKLRTPLHRYRVDYVCRNGMDHFGMMSLHFICTPPIEGAEKPGGGKNGVG